MKTLAIILIMLGLSLTTYLGIVSIHKENGKKKKENRSEQKDPFMVNPLLGIVTTGFGVGLMIASKKKAY